ncbi:unnamed protein product [Protopolystoma xenopodis]|uniref:Uncharacterized protein n=1 Tax=Protopolystoma xenopodis TaxID=117903 RepID=A0A3S5B168_9PLAT|nr:unnamed protein product [Protopolystoma xenopodis]
MTVTYSEGPAMLGLECHRNLSVGRHNSPHLKPNGKSSGRTHTPVEEVSSLQTGQASSGFSGLKADEVVFERGSNERPLFGIGTPPNPPSSLACPSAHQTTSASRPLAGQLSTTEDNRWSFLPLEVGSARLEHGSTPRSTVTSSQQHIPIRPLQPLRQLTTLAPSRAGPSRRWPGRSESSRLLPSRRPDGLGGLVTGTMVTEASDRGGDDPPACGQPLKTGQQTALHRWSRTVSQLIQKRLVCRAFEAYESMICPPNRKVTKGQISPRRDPSARYARPQVDQRAGTVATMPPTGSTTCSAIKPPTPKGLSCSPLGNLVNQDRM